MPQIRHSINTWIVMLAEDSMDRKGKFTPQTDVYSYKNKSLALPGSKVFNIVNLPSGWQCHTKSSALVSVADRLGIPRWQLSLGE